MNKSPAVNEMRRVGSQGEPVAVARLSGDCHALQRDIFRKLGNHAHTDTVIDLHIAERNIFAGRHIGGRITSRMMAKDDDMTRRIALKTLQVAGSLQRHLHQAFLQLFPDSVVGIRPDIKSRLVRSLGGLAFFPGPLPSRTESPRRNFSPVKKIR